MFQVLDSAAAARKPSNSRTLSSILQLEQDLRQSGEQFNSETYEHILSAYAKSDEDKSLELYERMVAEGIKPTRVYYHKALQVKKKPLYKIIVYVLKFI